MVMPMLQPREKIHWGNLFCRMYGLPSMMLSISTQTTIKTINKIPMAYIYCAQYYTQPKYIYETLL